MDAQIINIFRWIGRILGLLVLGIFLIFLIGEGFNLFQLTLTELLMTLCLLVVMVGIIIAWKNEGLGGAFIVGGMVAFYLVNFLWSGRFPGGPVFLLIFLPGIIFLVCWWLTRKN